MPSKRPCPFYQTSGIEHQYYGFRHFSSLNNNDNGGNTSDNDNGDDVEDWIPPNDSPLAARSNLSMMLEQQQPTTGLGAGAPPMSSNNLPITDGEIEIIDLEATISNQRNAEYLKSDNNNDNNTMEEEIIVSPEEFQVQSNDVEWKDILKELRDSGETDMMNRLVKEYSLQSHLDSLEGDTSGTNDSSSMSKARQSTSSTDVDDGGDWDIEFEASLNGLPEEEIIDELIENSFELSEMEIDILGQGMPEEGNKDDGLDLEESVWTDNDAYREFRKMVLDDYRERKRAREEEIELLKEIEEESKKVMHTPSTTKAYINSEYEAHPQDWKDYDSNSAFQRDFLDDSGDSWEPPTNNNAFIPSRNSGGDDGGQFAQKDSDASANANDLDNNIDWLQARRSRLGDNDDKSKKRPTHMMTPEEAERFSHKNSQIPVGKYYIWLFGSFG